MNIPKAVIEKAIEGGYEGAFINPLNQLEYRKHPAQIALDPLFWQALGKALEWEEGKKIYNRGIWDRSIREIWCENAHRFYDLILTGQPTEPFWDELLGVTK